MATWSSIESSSLWFDIVKYLHPSAYSDLFCIPSQFPSFFFPNFFYSPTTYIIIIMTCEKVELRRPPSSAIQQSSTAVAAANDLTKGITANCYPLLSLHITRTKLSNDDDCDGWSARGHIPCGTYYFLFLYLLQILDFKVLPPPHAHLLSNFSHLYYSYSTFAILQRSNRCWSCHSSSSASLCCSAKHNNHWVVLSRTIMSTTTTTLRCGGGGGRRQSLSK